MIEVRDISYKYSGSGHEVFAGLSFSLGDGMITGLLGRNGMGKSTLLYIMAGLLRPAKGTVSIDGRDPARHEAELLGDVFLVPEEFELPQIPLKKYVQAVRPFYPRFSDEALKSSLGEFGLAGDVHLKELSMGQKKKVMMSVALAANTRLLIMDEPTNGLDIPSKAQFRRTVAAGMSPERSIIVSTHQVHDVEQLLDHIVILDNSEVVVNAHVADITKRYSFGLRQQSEMDQTVVYAEPTLQGNAVMAERAAADAQADSVLNLELFFNAATQGKVRI